MTILQSIQLLEKITPVSAGLRRFLQEHVSLQKHKKNYMLHREGEVCAHIYLIRKGLVRGFFEVNDTEVTSWVRVDGEIITSFSGFFKHEASQENMECLEDCILEALPYNALQVALDRFPEMNIIFRHLIIEYYIAAEHRAFIARIPGAQERYNYLVQKFNPQTLQRAPQKYLASLIGMRPETFSRLKHAAANVSNS